MESLDNQWILQGNLQQCEQFEKTPNTLGLKNMAGVFILVGAGIIGGIGLIVIEMAYKKHQIRKQKRMELARHAADKWRNCIEVIKIPILEGHWIQVKGISNLKYCFFFRNGKQ